MVGSHPSVFKCAVSVLLSLIPSPGELSGDFFWPSSRRAKWNWLIITALQFLLRTNQFVSLVGNSVTLLMQGFDSPLPFGTQYKPSILFIKREKDQGLLWWFLQLSPTAHQGLRVLLSLGLWQEGGLYLNSGWILRQCWLIVLQGFEHLGDPLPYCSSVIPQRHWPQKTSHWHIPPATGNVWNPCSPQLSHHTRQEFILGGVVTQLATPSCSKGAHQPLLETKKQTGSVHY